MSSGIGGLGYGPKNVGSYGFRGYEESPSRYLYGGGIVVVGGGGR